VVLILESICALKGGKAISLKESIMLGKARWPGLLLTVAGLAGFIHPSVGFGQVDKPIDLPNGPAKQGFDITRLSSAGNGRFETFYVRQTQPLRKVLEDGKVAADTRLMVTETAGGRLALLTDQMAYHHLAQGRAGGKDWMATF
jgi:hypothetical protein